MEYPGASPSLALVGRFSGTTDLDTGTDDLGTLASARRWLEGQGLGAGGLDESGRTHLLELRTAVREALLANAGRAEAGQAWKRLNEIGARAHLRVWVGAVPMLEPQSDGVDAAIAALLAGIYDALRDGSWGRLKICREDRCAAAFYDRSKNGSGVWCSMAVCGNRNKARRRRGRARQVD